MDKDGIVMAPNCVFVQINLPLAWTIPMDSGFTTCSFTDNIICLGEQTIISRDPRKSGLGGIGSLATLVGSNGSNG